MRGDKFTVLFWTSHRICPFTGSALARMVFTEVKKTTLVFDSGLFIATTKAQLQKAVSPQEVDSYMTPFIRYLYYGDCHSFGVKNCAFISKLMYEQIVGGKVNLNENTPFSYDGNEKVNEVLEDCLTAVSSNSDRIWATLNPIMGNLSNLAVTIQKIRPLSWIQRKLQVQPQIIYDTTFESWKVMRISGTCKRIVLDVAGEQLEVRTNDFGWLR
jgi:hypothetical protein